MEPLMHSLHCSKISDLFYLKTNYFKEDLKEVPRPLMRWRIKLCSIEG